MRKNSMSWVPHTRTEVPSPTSTLRYSRLSGTTRNRSTTASTTTSTASTSLPSPCEAVTYPSIGGSVGTPGAPSAGRSSTDDAWHPTRQTPEFVASHLPYLREFADETSRDPDEITISLKRTLHFTDIGLAEGASNRSNGALIASTGEVIEDVKACAEIGIQQLTFDFRTPDIDDCIRTMEHFAEAVAVRV